MGTILSNEHAEALILDIRAASQASRAVIQPGAFVGFPTSVVVPSSRGGQLAFPLRVGLEPGSLCTADGEASVSGRVGEVDVSGSFSWRLGGRPADRPADYVFRIKGQRAGEPWWAGQLPRSVRLLRRSPAEIERDRSRLLRQGRLAEQRLLRLTQQVLESSCRGPLRSVLSTHRLVEEADLVQKGLQVALRLLPVYASPGRPPRTWLGMLHLDAKRDMHRAVSQLDWLPRDCSELVQRARLAGIELHSEPDLTLVALIDASLDDGQPLLRVSAAQARVALSTPLLESFDAPRGGRNSSPWFEGGLSAPDPALDAVHNQPGRAVASIAALINADPVTVAGAFLGDPASVGVVAEEVLARIRLPREGRTTTRQRSRRQFFSSGRLLTSSSFPEAAPRDLAALNGALRSALDLDPVA